MAAAARSATVRLASAATGRRAMSTAVKDMGGAIKPILVSIRSRSADLRRAAPPDPVALMMMMRMPP